MIQLLYLDDQVHVPGVNGKFWWVIRGIRGIREKIEKGGESMGRGERKEKV